MGFRVANCLVAEVTNRRRKYGLNQMKEEKENLLLKFFVCLPRRPLFD